MHANLWANVRAGLDNTRVEVFTDVTGAVALPWELLRDPKTDAALALRAKSFVRSYSKGVQKTDRPTTSDKIRILLVICRPSGGEDVPFRSVAGKLIKSLSNEAHETFTLDVLRPPTFEQLSKVFRSAKTKGEPYHIVHFDGHGGYLDTSQDLPPELLRKLIPLMLGEPREGSHGFLFFENPKPDNAEENFQLVGGSVLGKLLVETDVPILVLNACRSAHAEIQEQPKAEKEADGRPLSSPCLRFTRTRSDECRRDGHSRHALQRLRGDRRPIRRGLVCRTRAAGRASAKPSAWDASNSPPSRCARSPSILSPCRIGRCLLRMRPRQFNCYLNRRSRARAPTD